MNNLVDIGNIILVLNNWESGTVWCIDNRKNETKLLMGVEIPLKDDLIRQFEKRKKNQCIIFEDKRYYIFQFKYGISYVFCLDLEIKFNEDQLNIIYHYLYPFYMKELELRNETYLKKLLNGIKNTNKALNRFELYDQIVNNTYKVISKFKSISYWKYDYLECKFQYVVSKGNYEIEESIFAFPMDNLDLLMESKFIEVDKLPGIPILFKRETKIYFYPFLVDGQIDGVLVFELNTKLNSLSEDEIQMFATFSEQISVVLHNIHHYEKLGKLNEALLRRDEIHDNLSKLLLKNMGLDSIIFEMSKMINKEIIFIDFVNNKTIKSRRAFQKNFNSSEILNIVNVNNKKKTIPISFNGELNYIIYPLHREEMLTGCLIIETKKELTQIEYLVLEQGKLIILLGMLKEQQLVNFYTNKKREKFLQLMETLDQMKQKELIDELDLSTIDRYVITVISFKSYSSVIELDILMNQLISHLKRDFFTNISIAFANQEEIVFLFKLLNREDYNLLTRYLSKKLVSNEFNGLHLKVGISSEYKNIYSIGKPYFESKLVVKFLGNKDVSSIMTYKELGILGLFVHQSKDVIQNFLEELLGELLHEKNSILEETLIVYLNNNCNANIAASKLHIHINTFYYRIKKIEDIIGISFQNTNDMLKIQLAYFLRENFIK